MLLLHLHPFVVGGGLMYYLGKAGGFLGGAQMGLVLQAVVKVIHLLLLLVYTQESIRMLDL